METDKWKMPMTNNLLPTAFCLLARRWYSMPELFHDNRPEDF